MTHKNTERHSPLRRKINNAEHQLAFIEMLRLITDGTISPEEAVRAYHAVLRRRTLHPGCRSKRDLELTDQAMSYAASERNEQVSPSEDTSADAQSASVSAIEMERLAATPGWSPDFDKMNSTHEALTICRGSHESTDKF